MRLRSDDFPDGGAIPRRFTYEGDDLSPALEWSDAPPATRSFALLCDDPDASGGTWHHWAVCDIPAGRAGLAQGAGRPSGDADLKQATNDFGNAGYGGPCPPPGHGLHHYQFRQLALSVERLQLPATPTCPDVAREARKHLIAEAVLTGVYQR
jgi:Raf kinase inhibitor-like YbhB/YbcL family protein